MTTLPLDQTALLIVDFGPSKTGLIGQVGYMIRNSADAVMVARTTSGVYEVAGAQGQYGILKKFLSTIFSETAAGYSVVVDTGETDATLKFTHTIGVNFFERTALVSGVTAGAASTSTYIHDSSIGS